MPVPPASPSSARRARALSSAPRRGASSWRGVLLLLAVLAGVAGLTACGSSAPSTAPGGRAAANVAAEAPAAEPGVTVKPDTATAADVVRACVEDVQGATPFDAAVQFVYPDSTSGSQAVAADGCVRRDSLGTAAFPVSVYAHAPGFATVTDEIEADASGRRTYTLGRVRSPCGGSRQPSEAGAQRSGATVYTSAEVDQKPILEGGEERFYSVLVYPEAAIAGGMEGDVRLQFTVNRKGQVAAPQVLQGPSQVLEREAVRAMELMSYIPARKDGELVCVQVRRAVRFSLGN